MPDKSLLSAWELFRDELSRNMTPTREAVEEEFAFLRVTCPTSAHLVDNLIAVRLMASYEQAINEYLHPPVELKQGNIKAETLHLGTIYEALLQILVVELERRRTLPREAIRKIARSYPDRATFSQLISIGKKLIPQIENDTYNTIDHLRLERNKIHISAIAPEGQSVQAHEEYDVMRYRRKLGHFLVQLSHVLNQE